MEKINDIHLSLLSQNVHNIWQTGHFLKQKSAPVKSYSRNLLSSYKSPASQKIRKQNILWLGLSQLCSATFEQRLAFVVTFCGSSNLEHFLPLWATFEQMLSGLRTANQSGQLWFAGQNCVGKLKLVFVNGTKTVGKHVGKLLATNRTCLCLCQLFHQHFRDGKRVSDVWTIAKHVFVTVNQPKHALYLRDIIVWKLTKCRTQVATFIFIEEVLSGCVKRFISSLQRYTKNKQKKIEELEGQTRFRPKLSISPPLPVSSLYSSSVSLFYVSTNYRESWFDSSLTCEGTFWSLPTRVGRWV